MFGMQKTHADSYITICGVSEQSLAFLLNGHWIEEYLVEIQFELICCERNFEGIHFPDIDI